MKKRNQLPCPEWANSLALRQDDLLPAEHTKLQVHLATCSACAATFADYQDLITRIRALPHPESEPSLRVLPELFLVEKSQERGNHMNGNTVTDQQGMPETPESVRTLPRKKPWRQRVLALAAVLLVAFLAISFALLSTRPYAGNTGTSKMFTITQGWTQLAYYHGTGSQTIAVGGLSLPQFWGQALTCQGKGKLKIEMSGPGYLNDGGTDNCTTTSAPMIAPATIDFALSSEHIQKIQVTAPVAMSWSLLLLQETPQPAFSLNSAWVPIVGLGGTKGSGPDSIIGGVSPPTSPDGHQLPTPTRWAVLIVCLGTGQGSIQFTPDAGKVAFPSCNGQPILRIVDYPHPTQVQGVQAHPAKTMVWEIEVLACGSTNSNLCR